MDNVFVWVIRLIVITVISCLFLWPIPVLCSDNTIFDSLVVNGHELSKGWIVFGLWLLSAIAGIVLSGYAIIASTILGVFQEANRRW